MADSSPSSMFSIEEYPSNEQGAALPGTNPPSSRNGTGHRSSNLRRGQGNEPRTRTESASEAHEIDYFDELSQFRSRSRSAPSSLMVAARYGRELRRLSDEFDQSFMSLPRPKSANAASQMTENKGIRQTILDLLRWRSKDRSESE